MRKLGIIAVLSLLVVALAAVPALAANAHFLKASAIVDSSGNLDASFKEVGLGNNQNINYSFQGDAEAVYQCWNNGGRHPKAGNKETVSTHLEDTATLSSDKNGSITSNGDLELTLPGSGEFSCPAGQTMYLESVEYTNVSLVDTTNGITAISDGSYSSGRLHIAV
jgi:hypothetical protein